MLECLVVAGKLNDLVLILHGKQVFIFNAIKLLWKYTDRFNTVNKKKNTFCKYSDSCSKTGFHQKHSSLQLCHIILSFSPPFNFFRYLYVCVVSVWTHRSKCRNDKSIIWGYCERTGISVRQMTLEEIKSLPLSDSCWWWWSAEVNGIQVASAQKSCQQWQHFSLAPQILDLADVKLFARSQTKFGKSK